jgi:hypothetical protein
MLATAGGSLEFVAGGMPWNRGRGCECGGALVSDGVTLASDVVTLASDGVTQAEMVAETFNNKIIVMHGDRDTTVPSVQHFEKRCLFCLLSPSVSYRACL